MSEEEKKKEEEPEESFIERYYPHDVMDAFDEMWEEFRRNMERAWTYRPRMIRPWRRPWRMRRMRPWIRAYGSMIPRREAFADMVDAGDSFKIHAQFPGIPKDNIDINVTEDGVEISGKAKASGGRKRRDTW